MPLIQVNTLNFLVEFITYCFDWVFNPELLSLILLTHIEIERLKSTAE